MPASKNLASQAPPTPQPSTRVLRAFAYDPSLATSLQNYEVSEVAVRVPWEPDRQWEDPKTGKLLCEPGVMPGPVGDYLEVVDVDPASEAVYPPVDLNDCNLLAQDGLAPSEGNPQFHQQMVYAVAMTTIHHFERALGRRLFWSEMKVMNGRRANYIPMQRLRIYPHGLRDENAYYDSSKKALLFGYFPARPAAAADAMPGGMVFTCLSHDIVAHETTHAILDGLQPTFLSPSNVDVLAFHEAFADLVALFQHFTYPEILRHQIAQARGSLDAETLLGQLAVQFGQSTERRGALRDAIGGRDPKTGEWKLQPPDPDAYAKEKEPHQRGALLVGAVFDAFRAIYRHRTRDLLRIATGGTGVLPLGDLHPDLVGRLSAEAAKAAEHVLLMCIRAIDYCPPVDVTFGDYLRALITADFDLVPDDRRQYRVAMIEAFRARGIYPQDVRTLSVDSLRWLPPGDDGVARAYCRALRKAFLSSSRLNSLWDKIVNARTLRKDDPEAPLRRLTRMEVYWLVKQLARGFHKEIKRLAAGLARDSAFTRDTQPFGLNLNLGHPDDYKFEVHQTRPVHRLGPDGRMRQDLLIQIAQKRPGFIDEKQHQRELKRYGKKGQTEPPSRKPDFWFRGGATFLLDLESFAVRYAVQKSVTNDRRLERQRQFVADSRGTSLRSLYFGEPGAGQRLAALHMSED